MPKGKTQQRNAVRKAGMRHTVSPQKQDGKELTGDIKRVQESLTPNNHPLIPKVHNGTPTDKIEIPPIRKIEKSQDSNDKRS